VSWRSPRLWIALLSLLAVVSVAVVDMGRTAPGPLTTVHQREQDLRGRGGCAECHGGWTGTMTSACLDCHGVIGEQIEQGAGLHGMLDPRNARVCALCHSEHHGTSFALVNRRSFALAGIPDPEAFDHESIGWAMDGEHLELECSECHANAELSVLPAGEVRFLGLDRDCSTCHEDPHEGAMVLECAQCHGQAVREDLHSVDHDELLPLLGGHADVTCRECHAEDSPRSLEALVGSLGELRPRRCQACHESPHGHKFSQRVAYLASVPTGASCAVCHEAEHESFRDEELELTAEQHACSGFPLGIPHDELSCEDCHASELDEFTARYPGRRANDCRQCHEDPHGGQFAKGPRARFGCIACHAQQHFEPHDFTIEKHARATLPLTGAHVDTACEDCHLEPEAGGPRVFRGTPFRCEQCHADAHRGFFDEFEEELGTMEMGECARCHGTTTFATVESGEFDHGRWARFALLGAHAESDCEICHVPADEADDLGRVFGRIEDHFGAVEGCATCHDDPHRGEFDAPGLPRETAGRSGCARCHDETSFRALPHGFHHGRWTDFPLRGRHREIGCSDCHAPLRRADEHGRTWERANGAECADCHAEPHAGQFREDGRTDCTRCHESSSSFVDTVFLHNRDSRFVLEEAHAELACSACHEPVVVGTAEVVRYRPLPMECIDCHGVHEETLRLRKRRRR